MRGTWVGVQEIAGEKAGIFKPGVPAITVPQPEEAMTSLQVPKRAHSCMIEDHGPSLSIHDHSLLNIAGESSKSWY